MMEEGPRGLESAGSLELRALTTWLVFLGAVQALTIGTSLARLPLGRGLALGVVIVAVCVSALYGWRAWRGHDEAAKEPSSARGLPVILFGVLALQVLLWAAAWIKTDYSFDGNLYHIPVIHFWALQGHVSWVQASDGPAWCALLNGALNGFPSGAELLSFVLVRATGFDALLNACNLPFLPLGVLGVVYLSRTLGAGAMAAWLAGLLYLLVPVNIVQAPTTYVDSAFGSVMIALMACLCAAQLEMKRRGAPWRLVLPLSCAMGWVMSIKGTGPLFVGFGIVWLAFAWGAGLRKLSRAEWRAAGRRFALFLAVTACCVVLMGGYWILRNMIVGGSPIYPMRVAVAGFELFPGEPFEEFFDNRSQLPADMWDLSGIGRVAHAWLQSGDLGYWLENMGATANRRGGLGFLWILGCLPAMAALLAGLGYTRYRAGPDRGVGRLAVFLPLLLFGLAAFLATPYNWWARYTVWIYGAGLPAFAVAVRWAWQDGRWRTAARCWATACMALLVFEGANALSCVLLHPPPYWIPQEGTTYWKPESDSIYRRALADQDAAIALFDVSTRRQALLGAFCQPIGRRPIYLLDEAVVADEEALKAFIERNSVRYLFCGTGRPAPDAIAKLEGMREEYSVWRVSLAAIPE